MVTVGARLSKVAMVLYELYGEERKYWLGLCFELAKVDPLGNNGDVGGTYPIELFTPK